MQIDASAQGLQNEADVETKVMGPLLLGSQYLGFPSDCVYTRTYLAPAVLDKIAGKTTGYFPDYTIWYSGFITTVVEVKAPSVEAETGYREASLYARHINQQLRTGLNPCKYIVSCNGSRLLLGFWDSNPEHDLRVLDLVPGSAALAIVRTFLSLDIVRRHSLDCLQRARIARPTQPYQLAGGPVLLTARKPLSTFAPELSPILRRYFSTNDPSETPEVVEKAYVATAEITEYDRVLESLLKDRLATRNQAIIQELTPTRKSEPSVTMAIGAFSRYKFPAGQLQIVQGAVGTGKSIFIRRYKEFLQPVAQRMRTRWSFIDFISAPPPLASPEAQRWLCRRFAESLAIENPSLDLNSAEAHRGIYSRELQKRRPIYEDVAKDSPEQAARLRGEDSSKWQDDLELTARGLSEYVIGGRNEILVVVMDNVDKLQLSEQLSAFELTIWFLTLTRGFCILQMRDETYERYKDRPPLDTFRSSVSFHVTPPRFIDVVKRRLDLGVEHLLRESEGSQEYTLESGAKIVLPSSSLGEFLHVLYIELFSKNRNIARLVESLAGIDVRRGLEIFSSIITSGHLPTTAITSTVRGAKEFPITEVLILKILMRTGYRLASDQSGFTSNIFFFESSWEKPDNFIMIETLFFLSRMRRTRGQIGLEGFFTVAFVADELQKLGYVRSDVLACTNHILTRGLISADHQSLTAVTFDDAVRILPAGFMHLRVLPESLEYCYGVIPTVPVVRITVAQELANTVQREISRDDVSEYDQVLAVEKLYNYLLTQKHDRQLSGEVESPEMTGADYVIDRMRDALSRYWDFPVSLSRTETYLDEV